nr:nickel-responsive transcriptional regulator NikR [Bacteroidota bacterium]
MALKRFGVSLEENLLDDLDQLVERQKFPNRSQAIRFLVSQLKVDDKWNGDEEVAGAIVLVYDHHKKDLQTKSTDIQHDFHDLILSVQHVHLDHNNCLETIAVKGRASQLKTLSDGLISLKGVKHGKLVMSTCS